MTSPSSETSYTVGDLRKAKEAILSASPETPKSTELPEANAVDLAATSKRSEGGALSPPTGQTDTSVSGVGLDEIATRWRHKKRGTTYTEVGRAKGQSAFEKENLRRGIHRIEGVTFVVYRSDDDGSIWVRKRSEFDDGRFERLSRETGANQSDGTAGKADPRGNEPRGKDTSTQGAEVAPGPSDSNQSGEA